MAVFFNDALTQYLQRAAAVGSTLPFTMACWFYTDDLTIQQTLMSIGDTAGTNEEYALTIEGATAGDPIGASARSGGTTSRASTTTGASANTWHHACGVFAASNNRKAYIDGGSKGTNTASRSPTGLDTTRIGARVQGASPSVYMSGHIAEAAIWNRALSDSDVALLAAGYAPSLVQPGNLVAYWDLTSDIADNQGTYDLTAFGSPTLGSDHPPALFYSLPAAPTGSESGTYAPTRWQIWLDDDRGRRLALLERVVSARYTPVFNDIGSFQVVLPGDFDRSLIRDDGLIEFWRGGANMPLLFRGVGKVRRVIRTEGEDGTDVIILEGGDQNELLNCRIVAYASGSAQSTKTDYADDMAKEVISQNFGAGATDAARSWAGINFTIAGDVGQAPSITKSFAWKNVLAALKDIANASYEAGTPLYFTLLPRFLVDGTIGFEFVTYVNQPGLDRTGHVMFGKSLGNLTKPRFEEDATGEATVIYCGGQGQEADREIVTVSNTARLGASAWGRREVFADARNETPTAAVTAKANEELSKRKRKRRFTATLLDTQQAIYGVDWNDGDRVTVEYAGEQFDGIAISGTLQLDKSGSDRVEARFEIEE